MVVSLLAFLQWELIQMGTKALISPLTSIAKITMSQWEQNCNAFFLIISKISPTSGYSVVTRSSGTSVRLGAIPVGLTHRWVKKALPEKLTEDLFSATCWACTGCAEQVCALTCVGNPFRKETTPGAVLGTVFLRQSLVFLCWIYTGSIARVKCQNRKGIVPIK